MSRVDKSIIYMWKVILFNARLNMYDYYIKLAKNNGYKVCSLRELYKDTIRGGNPNQKHFVLRHDVDHISPGTRKMFEIEKSNDVKSTYYFRKCTTDEELMKEMQTAGYEVGFHYETIAEYVESYGKHKLTTVDIYACRDILKQEIREFNELLDAPMESICSHGAPANARIGVSSNVLLENQNYKDYGIKFEAYDKALYERFVTHHICDGNICYNYGFSYEDNPIDNIEHGDKNIVFLAHPEHWYNTKGRILKDMVKMLIHRVTYNTQRKFRRIATEGIQPY